MSLPLDILTTKYIRLITKKCFFSTSSKGFVQIKKYSKQHSSLLKNPKIFAEKEKSAVLASNSVFRLSNGRDINFKNSFW